MVMNRGRIEQLGAPAEAMLSTRKAGLSPNFLGNANFDATVAAIDASGIQVTLVDGTGLLVQGGPRAGRGGRAGAVVIPRRKTA